MAKTGYHMLGILSFSDREKALPPSTEISVLTLVVKKSTMKLITLQNGPENLKLNVVLVLQSKALYKLSQRGPGNVKDCYCYTRTKLANS